MDDERIQRHRPSWWSPGRALVIVGSVIILAVAAGSLVEEVAAQGNPPLGADALYVGPGISPGLAGDRVEAIALAYLDAQTPQLAAPALHEPPAVLSESVTTAAAATNLEPDIPRADAGADPGRIVWVVRVSGDLLNLGDLPWSRSGAPDPSGTIVIDDASGTILGVFPHDPPGIDASLPPS